MSLIVWDSGLKNDNVVSSFKQAAKFYRFKYYNFIIG